MIKCKVEGCEEEEELKDGRGLSMHLRAKHKMTLDEYKVKYGDINQEEVSKKDAQPLTGVDPDEVPMASANNEKGESLEKATDRLRETFKYPQGKESISKSVQSEREQLGEEVPAESEPLSIIIENYTLLSPELTMSAMFVDGEEVIQAFKRAVAIGTVQINDVSMISVLIISDDGTLIPPSVIPGFYGMVETKFESTPKKQTKKGFFRKKKKTEERPMQNVNPETLITEFSRFLKTKIR